jgi:hypothetical protein
MALSRACSATSFLQPSVLAFQLLEPLGIVGLHHAVLLAPAVESRFGRAQPLAGLGEGRAAAQQRVGLTQLGDDVFRAVPSSFRREPPLPATA